jgi:hypothetical protein
MSVAATSLLFVLVSGGRRSSFFSSSSTISLLRSARARSKDLSEIRPWARSPVN